MEQVQQASRTPDTNVMDSANPISTNPTDSVTSLVNAGRQMRAERYTSELGTVAPTDSDLRELSRYLTRKNRKANKYPRKRKLPNTDDKPKETAAQRKLRKQNEFLKRRKQERIAGVTPQQQRPPRSVVDEAALEHRDNKYYRAALDKLSREKPTEEQVSHVEWASTLGPNYLGRTASQDTGFAFEWNWNASNGFTSDKILMPAADTHADQGVHDNMTDMTQGALVYMLGQHLIWNDLPSDEFLSYSKDPLFLVIHALNRFHQNQAHVTIQFLDRRRAKDFEGRPSSFYHALDLYEAFEVPKWSGWTGQSSIKLHPRKFTQELLSHGAVVVQDDRLKAVTVDKLIEDGLYNIFPTFRVSRDLKRAGLYMGQVSCRMIGYPPGNVKVQRHRRVYSYPRCSKPVPLTVEFLTKLQKLTRNFMTDPTEEPHLHIFLSFLTFEKRLKKDLVFLDWIKAHYQREDVIDLYDDGAGGVRPGFTHVANNLPGVMQYLDLVRDASFACGLPSLPKNVIEKENSLTRQAYAQEDAKQHKTPKTWEIYDKASLLDKREKDKEARKRKKEGIAAKVGVRAQESSVTTSAEGASGQILDPERSQESDEKQTAEEEEGNMEIDIGEQADTDSEGEEDEQDEVDEQEEGDEQDETDESKMHGTLSDPEPDVDVEMEENDGSESG